MTDELPIPERLFNGVRLLGQLWRSGVRCSAGWSATCEDGTKKTKFCGVKAQWCQMKAAQLAGLGKRVAEYTFADDPLAMIKVMGAAEIDALGFTVVFKIAGQGDAEHTIGAGTGKASSLKMADLVQLADKPDGAWSVFTLLGMMKGSKVVEYA